MNFIYLHSKAFFSACFKDFGIRHAQSLVVKKHTNKSGKCSYYPKIYVCPGLLHAKFYLMHLWYKMINMIFK